MTIKEQCKEVLSDGTPRSVAELSRDVAEKFGRSEKTVSATIYQDVLSDPDFAVSDGRPKQLSLP